MSEPREENFLRCIYAYELAVELGEYRAAARFASQALRARGGAEWRWRLRGAFTRRNRR